MSELPVTPKVAPPVEVAFSEGITGSSITWFFWVIALLWLAVQLGVFRPIRFGAKASRLLPNIWGIGALWCIVEFAIATPQICSLLTSPGAYTPTTALADLELLSYVVSWILIETALIGVVGAILVQRREPKNLEAQQAEDGDTSQRPC